MAWFSEFGWRCRAGGKRQELGEMGVLEWGKALVVEGVLGQGVGKLGGVRQIGRTVFVLGNERRLNV